MSFQSLLGYHWQKSNHDERAALAIAQKFDLSHFLGKLLAARNISLEEVENFLYPSIKATLPDPFLLLDMKIAVAKIVEAIKENKKIVIFGDYDVDGATSSALLKRFFRSLEVEAQIYIPDRISEGYGPNSSALLKLREEGTDLVITVDCGTVAFEPLKAAASVGLDIIVIDHHLGAMEKPEAIAVINPNRLDENFEHKNPAAVGVCFLLAVAINKTLRETGFYEKNNLSEPKLLSLLDLVALGTVCDVVPLSGINRAFVTQGLKVLKSRQNVGIRAITDLAGLDEEPGAYHLGFVIGPRINAGGRVGKSDLGARLLSTDDEDEAVEIAKQLHIYNQQRKDIEAQVLEEAKAEIAKNNLDKLPVIIVAKNNWHPGVIGIVASRIKDLYEKPVAVIALKDGVGKASCRSITGIDFGGNILEAKLEGILIEGGGHAMAAGFSIAEENIPQLQEFLNKKLKEKVELLSSQKIKQFADILDVTSANLALAKEIAMLEPHGAANSKPKFLIDDLLIVKADLIGSDGKHVRCIFSNKTIAGFQNGLVGVAFNAMENGLGEVLISKNKGKKLKAVGHLNINRWMGSESVQLMIEDLIL